MTNTKWSYIPLSKLCDINIGKTPSRSKPEYWGAGFTWVSISDLKEKHISKTKEEITEVAVAESNCKIVKEGTLLMSFKLSIGKLAFAGKDLYTNEAIVALPIKDETELNKEYLYYALKFIPLVGGNQAAMGQTLNKQSLSVLQIPIPPTIDDQKRIAKILSQCEALIKKRKESIELLDELLKSTFLEMFGDPVRNEKGWSIEPMYEAVIDIRSGVSYGGKEKTELNQDELGVLKISAVTNGSFNPKEYKAVNKREITKELLFLKKGMFLLSRANTRELVAACCIVPDDFPSLFIPDKLWSLTFNLEKVNPVFFNFLLKNENYRNLTRKEASGGHDSMLNISMKKFRNLNVPIPDSNVQDSFAHIVEKVEALKNKFNESLKELENLYGSISQRAFNGELDLSNIDISDMEDSKKKDLEVVEEDLTEEQLDDLLNSFEHTLPTGEVPSNRETNIRNMSIRQYLNLPDNEEIEGIEFSYMNKDFFYQFILTQGFADRTFTLPELEQYARKYILRGTGFEFTYNNWKTIIFRFIGAKQPIIEQVFDEDDKTIKLKLTDEAFKV